MLAKELAEYEAEHQKVKIGDLREGDMVDLQWCPYLSDHPTAEFEYAQVCYVRDEGDIVAVGYEGIDEVGYDKNQEMWIKPR